MAIFKICRRIQRRSIFQQLIYFLIPILLALVVGQSAAADSGQESFSPKRATIAIMNEDEDSALSRGLVDYLSARSKVVALKPGPDALRDALFYQLDYAIRIPKGFTADFMAASGRAADPIEAADAGRAARAQEKLKLGAPIQEYYLDSKNPAMIDVRIMVEDYLDAANRFLLIDRGMSQQALTEKVQKNLARRIAITMRGMPVKQNMAYYFYFQYVPYGLLEILLAVYMSVLVVLNDRDLRRRQQCSPLSWRSQSLKLFGILAGYCVGVWLLFAIAGFCLFGRVILAATGLALLLNALAFSLFSAALAFFVAQFLNKRNRGMISGIGTVLPLVLCFLGGNFIPYRFLSHGMQMAGRFIPNQWYIRVVDAIQESGNMTQQLWVDSLLKMAVVMAFALVFLLWALAVARQKRQSEAV